MRHRCGERAQRNITTGDTRRPHPSLQPPPRRFIRNIDWSKEGKSPDSSASTLTLPSTPSRLYVPPLPEDRGAVDTADWTNTED